MTNTPTTTTNRKYLFALVDGGGTVPPELGAARRLLERGHDVVVLAEDSMRADVEATGATFRPWTEAPNRASRRPEDDPYRDWECRNPLQLFTLLLDRQFVGPAPAYAADTAAAIDELRPDLVVCSMFVIGGMVAAEAAGVPFDVLFPNPYLLPTPGIPPFGLGLRPAKGRPGRVRDAAIRRLTNRQWDKGLARLNALRTSLGLEPVRTFFDQVRRARRHLVLTSADFDFPGDVGPQVRYVGAVLDDPAWASEATWTPPPDDRPLVLVALSSTFQDQVGCLQRIVDALGALPVHGIVTTGPALQPEALAAPPNVSVVAAAPHSRDPHPRRRRRHPWRPRHGGAHVGRRGPDGGAAPRTRSGRQRRPGHHPWRRVGRASHRRRRRHRRRGPPPPGRARLPGSGGTARYVDPARRLQR